MCEIGEHQSMTFPRSRHSISVRLSHVESGDCRPRPRHHTQLLTTSSLCFSPVSLQLAVGHSFMLLRFVTLPSLNN